MKRDTKASKFARKLDVKNEGERPIRVAAQIKQEVARMIGRELADPRNKTLDTFHLQRMLMSKHLVRLKATKNGYEDEKVLENQRRILKMDPTTLWGIGAVGYLGMYRRSESPFLVYGFDAGHQAKAGRNAWILADAWKEVDHAGPYTLSITSPA